MDFIAQAREYWSKKEDAKVLVGTRHYWPLPYYFRDRGGQVSYSQTDEPRKYLSRYDIVVVDHRIRKTFPGWKRSYRRLSDVQEAQIYTRELDE